MSLRVVGGGCDYAANNPVSFQDTTGLYPTKSPYIKYGDTTYCRGACPVQTNPLKEWWDGLPTEWRIAIGLIILGLVILSAGLLSPFAALFVGTFAATWAVMAVVTGHAKTGEEVVWAAVEGALIADTIVAVTFAAVRGVAWISRALAERAAAAPRLAGARSVLPREWALTREDLTVIQARMNYETVFVKPKPGSLVESFEPTLKGGFRVNSVEGVGFVVRGGKVTPVAGLTHTGERWIAIFRSGVELNSGVLGTTRQQAYLFALLEEELHVVRGVTAFADPLEETIVRLSAWSCMSEGLPPVIL